MSSWDCTKCNEVNPESKGECRRCGYDRFWYSKTLNAKIRKVEGK
jgi:ribosomal protein L40E